MDQLITRSIGMDKIALLREGEGRGKAVLALVDLILSGRGKGFENDSSAFLSKTVELIHQSSPDVQASVARKMVKHPAPPKELISALLLGHFQGAKLILNSQLPLETELLLEILKTRGLEYALEIARRPLLERPVIAALMAKDDPTLIQAMCETDLILETAAAEEKGETIWQGCSLETLTVLFWASPKELKHISALEMSKRNGRPLLEPLFMEEANQAIGDLMLVGSTKDLWRALHGFISAPTLAAAHFQAEESGYALGAACKVLHLAPELFTQLVIRLKGKSGFSIDHLHRLERFYTQLQPGTGLALLRELDEECVPWAEYARPLPKRPPGFAPASNAITGYGTGARPQAASQVSPASERPLEANSGTDG